MKKLVAGWGAAASLAMLGGCGALSSLMDDKIDYKSQATLPPLEVPPDLTTPSRDARFNVPDSGRSTATLSGYQAERKEGRTNTSLLPQVEQMRVERAGSQRWLVVNLPADKVWPLVKDFWQESGFLIRTEVPEAGVMETEWAENRAKIPQGFVRELLGKAFENLHSTAERDKFRTRLERTPDGQGTEIYLSHRGMEEVYTDGVEAGKTIWQPRASDPGLEAEFLQRLMVRLGAREERAKQLASVPPAPDRAQIVKSNDGTQLLQVNEPFDRTWRRVGLALDRVGFTVEDRDRQNGLYFVRYADADAEMEKPGLLTRILGLDADPVKAEQYRVQVRQENDQSQVNVLNKNGGTEGSKTAQRILSLLHEQLK
jgi:outer membrane protein assembly factor BamC